MHKELAECINHADYLEDVAKEFNDHAANSGHFPPKKMARVLFYKNMHGPFFIGGGGGRVAVYGYEYDYLFKPPPKYGHPPPPL